MCIATALFSILIMVCKVRKVFIMFAFFMIKNGRLIGDLNEHKKTSRQTTVLNRFSRQQDGQFFLIIIIITKIYSFILIQRCIS
jgi:hypothetical protein